MKAVLDTNVVVRHLIGDHPRQSPRATRLFEGEHELELSHVIFAETVFVLECFYGLERAHVAFLCWALLALPSVAIADPRLVLRALAIYVQARIDFADAYASAGSEASAKPILSFDRDLDRVSTVERIEP